jgi:hypothetical protein
MKSRRLGCFTATGLLAAVLTLLLVLGVFLLRGGRMFSPGPLHAQASGVELDGVVSHADTGGDCTACHTAPWNRTTMAQRCLDCHTAIAANLADATTLHGALQSQGADMDCRQCHTDHRGPDANLTFADMNTFPHDVVGFSLAGHSLRADGSPFTCTDCHTESLARFDVLTCDDCHHQIESAFMQTHVADFGADCLACHDGIDSYSRANFDHSRVFSLTGKHTDAACSDCHAGAGTIADLQAAPTDCYACHAPDDAHDGQFGQDCAACHTTSDWRDATFDHSLTAFPLTGQHVEVECSQCHVDRSFQGTPTDCVACHVEPAFHLAAFGATACSDCHTTSAWQPARFDRPHTFPLDHGESGISACQTCHPTQVQDYTCYGCHEHQPAEIEEEHRDEGITDFQDCVSCHPTGLEDEAENRNGD